MATLLERNLLALARVLPHEAKRILDAPDFTPLLTPARSGAMTLERAVPGAETAGPVLLHSRYDPGREARRAVEGLSLGPTDTVFLLGFGLGYTAAAIIATQSVEVSIVAIEAEPGHLRAALSLQDFTAEIAAGRLAFFTPSAPGDALKLVEENVEIVFGGKAHFVDHEPSRRFAADYYRRCRGWLADAVEHGRMLLATQMLLPARQFENFMGNVVDYVTSPGVRELAGVFRGLPGVLVGAGPSLAADLPLLREARERAIILAVSTALRPVAAAGITPHFTNLVDFHGVSARYFEDLGAAEGVPVFVDPLAAHEAVAACRGPKVFKDDPVLNHVLDLPDGVKGDLDAGGSVAHFGFALLEMLGCDPIILVGLDLSYAAGVTHVPGTAFYRQWRALLSPFCTFEMLELECLLRRRQGLHPVASTAGGVVYTNPDMHSYVRDLGLLAGRFKGRCINATPRGALIEHTVPVPLAEALRALPARPVQARAVAPKALDPDARRAALDHARAALRRRREEVAAALAAYERLVPAATEAARRLAAEPEADVSRLAARVAEQKAAARACGRAHSLMVTMSRAVELARLRREREIRGRALAGADLARAEAERDAEFFSGLIARGREIAPALDRALSAVERALGTGV
ncbi:MAG: DUF115 domain-containing protein [Planctomycetes bacterium]|nr:DUF115 domain-containing protein [Planctomycetota bacterium]